jgi:hypothetical protein
MHYTVYSLLVIREESLFECFEYLGLGLTIN